MAESTYPRNVRRALKLALTDTPVVALLGPRQSGKSTLVRALAPGRAYVTLDEQPMLRTAKVDPVGFIAALPSQRSRARLCSHAAVTCRCRTRPGCPSARPGG